MREYLYKSIFRLCFQIQFLIFIIISQIECVEQIKSNLVKRKKHDDDDDDDDKDSNEKLSDLKKDIQKLSKDISSYDTLINILIPTASIFLLIIIIISCYEIIKKYCKKPMLLNAQNITPNYYFESNYNYNKLINSTTDSSSIKLDKENQVSNYLVSSKNINNSNINNIDNEKEEENNINNLGKNEYDAPTLGELTIKQQDDTVTGGKINVNNEKISDSDDKNSNSIPDIPNPYV